MFIQGPIYQFIMPDDIFRGYAFDLQDMIKQIEQAKAKTVGLQLPEGLKRRSAALAKALKDATRAEIIIFGEECFGACDIIPDAKADIIFNIGHSDIPNMTLERDKYRFIELSYDIEYQAIYEHLPLVELGKKVGLVSSVQHTHALEGFKQYLEDNGITAVIAPGNDRVVHPGQILGCNFSAAKNCGDDVDAFIFLGSGRFHALGIYLALGKPVFILDPYSGLVALLEKEASEQFIKTRWGAISRAKQANTFGIIVSRKPGQYRHDIALKVKSALDKAGKEAHIITLDLLTPQRLDTLGLDAYVVTACPRIAIDDSGSYNQPLLTPVEVEALLGNTEELVFDEID